MKCVKKILVLLSITLFFTSSIFVPSVLSTLSFDYNLEQNDNSVGIWAIDDFGSCIAQSFVPTEDFYIQEIEFYVEVESGYTTLYGGVTSTLSNNHNNWLGGAHKYDSYNIDTSTDGWICYCALDKVLLIEGYTYYIILKNAGSLLDSCAHGNYENPYSEGSAFWCGPDNDWTNGNDDYDFPDFAFKIRGSINSPANAPTLVSPSDDTTFTISEGGNKDVDLTAVATDPNGDDIAYRFYDASTDDPIETTGFLDSGEQGTVTWENLGDGTYQWYAKAGDGGPFGEPSETWSFTIEEESDPPEEYTLTMSVSPSRSGTTDPSVGTHTYTAGEVVDIEAFANSGYTFSGWRGDKTGSQNPTTITMNRDNSITANFVENDEPEIDFSFVHVTDMHINSVDSRSIWNWLYTLFIVCNLGPDFIVCTGDIANDGLDSKAFDAFKDPYSHLPDDWKSYASNQLGALFNYRLSGSSGKYSVRGIPLYCCPGNHDSDFLGNGNFEYYLQKIGPHYFKQRVDGCPVDIFSLNTGTNLFSTAYPRGRGLSNVYDNEVTNFKRDLSSSSAEYKIVLTHHPYIPFEENVLSDGIFNYYNEHCEPYGPDENEPGQKFSGTFGDWCDEENVDLILSGHLHNSIGPDNRYGCSIGSTTDHDSIKLSASSEAAYITTPSVGGENAEDFSHYRLIDVYDNGEIDIHYSSSLTVPTSKIKDTSSLFNKFFNSHPNMFSLLRFLQTFPVIQRLIEKYQILS